jgi:hypothetical protein
MNVARMWVAAPDVVIRQNAISASAFGTSNSSLALVIRPDMVTGIGDFYRRVGAHQGLHGRGRARAAGAVTAGQHGSGAQQRKRARARHAATLNAVAAVQGIALDAAEGDETARGQLIQVLRDMHETLQPTKQEAAKGGQGPILPQFNRLARASPSLSFAKTPSGAK